MRTVSEREFLGCFPRFKRGDPDVVRELLAGAHLERIPAGVMLQLAGERCAAMQFLLSGETRVFKNSGTGREITLYEVQSGEICILNAASILANSPCPASARALTDLEMLRISPEAFIEMVHRHPAMRDFIFSSLNEMFTGMVELIDEIVFRKLDERLLEYLVEKSEDGRLETTHQIIADDLGTAREVVSRLLKNLEKDGRVQLGRGRIRLLRL
jgi:CRP/FNR family transcriptional regulator